MSDGMFDPGVSSLTEHNTAAHGSPLFDYLTAFVPRKLKDLFRLCEYLYFNSAQIFAALQKFCTYPVTNITYDTQNESLKAYFEDLHDKTLKTKRILIRAALDKYVYGNAFFSMYSPFVRFLKCPKCSVLSNITQVSYRFKLKKLSFNYECAGCKIKVDIDSTGIIDRKITRKDRISVIRWDPKLIDIDYNPITGHSEYYYTIPKELKERAAKGNKHLIDTMPMEFLKALKDDKIFKFAEGQIFHIKMDAPAGIEPQWGNPVLSSTIKLFFYAAVLRKANECVALDALIETPTGLIKADDVNIGDLVRSHTGNWRAVTDKWYRNAKSDEIGHKITLTGLRYFPITYSPKHPILTIRRNQFRRQYGDKDTQTSTNVMRSPRSYEEVLVPANQLIEDDYVLYPRKLPTNKQVIDIKEYTNLNCSDLYAYTNRYTPLFISTYEAIERDEHVIRRPENKSVFNAIRGGRIPARMTRSRILTTDFAYILGWYAGDGSCGRNEVDFNLGLDDDPIPLVNAIKREFNKTAGNTRHSRDAYRNIIIYDTMIMKLFKGILPGHAATKQIPIEVINGTDDIKLAFLKGYDESDGHNGKSESTWGTSSKNLAYGTYRLLLHFGCVASIQHTITKDRFLNGKFLKGGNSFYYIKVCGASRRRLQALWNGTPPEVIDIGHSGFFWKDYFASRIHKIEHVNEPRYIDFKVDIDETFCTAGTASHNSIALDYIVPLRIISPKVASGNGDPVTTISLSKWSNEMKHSVKKWRRDPLHIMWSPIPAEVTHLGGQARALMTLGEVQAAEDNIIAAMGLPKEFIYGGFSAMGSGIQLRVLENQLVHQTGDLNDLLQWITDKSAQQLGRGTIPVSLAPFRFIDDVQQKALMLQLNMADPTTGPWLSRKTLGESFEIDPNDERKWRKQEAIDDARTQQELQLIMTKRQGDLANRARSQAQMGQQAAGLNYDQQAVIAQADQIVAQLQGLDQGSRQSQMHALQSEDAVMYAVVRNRMEEQTTAANHEALTQVKQQQGGGDPTGGMGGEGGGVPPQ